MLTRVNRYVSVIHTPQVPYIYMKAHLRIYVTRRIYVVPVRIVKFLYDPSQRIAHVLVNTEHHTPTCRALTTVDTPGKERNYFLPPELQRYTMTPYTLSSIFPPQGPTKVTVCVTSFLSNSGVAKVHYDTICSLGWCMCGS